ncbi:hypothetical protein C0J52_27446 [Blattella germanica]|nr:hypothetical protein C0J52_27446 [Blattella germanica]
MYLKTDLISGQIEDLNARWLELPYEVDGHQYSFIIVIPKEVDDFDNLQKKFTAQHFSTLLEGLQSPDPWKIQVFMPKFKLESNLNNLVDILKKLGLTDIFTDVAQLQKITGTPVKINEIIQKAVIIVDENGSEAAAVTGGVLILAPAPPPRVETFRVDRPFLYFIIDKVNSIPLFAGRKLLWKEFTCRKQLLKVYTHKPSARTIVLLQEVFDKDPGNVVVSPVSLSTLLAIVHQAAASNTRKQLTQVLHAGPQALRSGYSDIILGIKVTLLV